MLNTGKIHIPKYALEKAEEFKKTFLRKYFKSASDLHYRFFYDKEGKACLEFTVIPKGNFTWPKPTWIGYTWGNINGFIGNKTTNYLLTKKLSDEAQYRMEERRKELIFKRIESIVYQIAVEYDYDWEKAYGIRVKYKSKNTKKAVCGGYADAVSNAFANHSSVTSVEYWTSKIGNHAWNVINLKDNRKIYCDSTWYDGFKIDEKGYVISAPDQNPVNLTFDINEFNSLGGAIDKATGKVLSVHFGWKDAKLSKKG